MVLIVYNNPREKCFIFESIILENSKKWCIINWDGHCSFLNWYFNFDVGTIWKYRCQTYICEGSVLIFFNFSIIQINFKPFLFFKIVMVFDLRWKNEIHSFLSLIHMRSTIQYFIFVRVIQHSSWVPLRCVCLCFHSDTTSWHFAINRYTFWILSDMKHYVVKPFVQRKGWTTGYHEINICQKIWFHIFTLIFFRFL